MTLLERLNNDLKAALRSGDVRQRSVIRLVLAAVKNAALVKNGPLTPDEVAATLKAAQLTLSREQIQPALEASWEVRRGGAMPEGVNAAAVTALAAAGAQKAAQAGDLTDAEIEEVIQRQAKQRRDSIEAYRKAGREDLAANEEAELSLLAAYLPTPLTADELRDLASMVIAEIGATSPRDMGRVIPAVLARAGQRAEGRLVSSIVKDVLSRS